MQSPPRQVEITLNKFAGTSDPDLYLEWESHADRVFDYCQYSDSERVDLAAIHFTGYALSWWNREEKRVYDGKPFVKTWNEMKRLLRNRFVPYDYRKFACAELNHCRQGKRNPEDYYRELEQLIWKAGISYSTEDMKARFLDGLNRQTKVVLEMLPFESIRKLVHQSDLIYERLQKMECLVDDEDDELEVLFDYKCKIKGEVCSVYISRSSCCNAINDEVVKRLKLPTMEVPVPYFLKGIDGNHRMRVEKQARVEFTIGGYKDRIVFDVIPLQACDLLLGVPWIYDRGVMCDVAADSYVFDLYGRRMTLVVPPPPQHFLGYLKRD